MKTGNIYRDNAGNKAKVISDDYTGLKRPIVYAQFLNRGLKPLTKKDIADNSKAAENYHNYFSIWKWDWNQYELIK